MFAYAGNFQFHNDTFNWQKIWRIFFSRTGYILKVCFIVDGIPNLKFLSTKKSKNLKKTIQEQESQFYFKNVY